MYQQPSNGNKQWQMSCQIFQKLAWEKSIKMMDPLLHQASPNSVRIDGDIIGNTFLWNDLTRCNYVLQQGKKTPRVLTSADCLGNRVCCQFWEFYKQKSNFLGTRESLQFWAVKCSKKRGRLQQIQLLPKTCAAVLKASGWHKVVQSCAGFLFYKQREKISRRICRAC